MPKQEPDKTQLITFYSYKGGVGRTMALANAACQLAHKHGKHVICVDWDLEAPGLHHYFGYTDEELAGRAGLLDYLLDFVWQVSKGSAGSVPELQTYLHDLKDQDRQKISHGSVQFMHCGRTDANHMARVQDFNWQDFYARHHGYQIIETLKKQLRQAADLTLIDARAGQADVGATPTIQVADAVVILFTSNRQNVVGAGEMALRLATHPMRKEQNLPPPKIVLVPARVFPREERFQRWIEQSAAPMFGRLVRDGIVSAQDQPKGLWECILPVDPKFSVDERLVVLDSPPGGSDLRDAYVNLAQALDNLHRGRNPWAPSVAERGLPTAAETLQDLRAELARAAERGDKDGVALLQFKLAREAIDRRKYDEAEALLASSLAHSKTVDNKQAISAIAIDQGRIRAAQGRLDEAWSLYERALKLFEQAGDVRAQAITLSEMGRVRQAQDVCEEAWSLYERALRLAEQAGDVRGQAITLLEMADVRQAQTACEEAWSLYERALRLAEQAGDVRGQAISLQRMGDVRQAQKTYDEAWSLYERALTLYGQAGDVGGQAVTLHEMGNVRQDQKAYDEAWSLYERSLSLDEQGGDVGGQGITLHEMGNVQRVQKAYDEAWSLYERALRFAEEVPNVQAQAVILHSMGLALIDRGRPGEARAFLERGLEKAEAAGDKKAVGVLRLSLSQLEAEGKTATIRGEKAR